MSDINDLFLDLLCDSAAPVAVCNHCGRVHFTHESDDYRQLQANAVAEPEKYIEDKDNFSIAWGVLDGKQYVWRCPCSRAIAYEEFVWKNRHLIAKYIRARIEIMKRQFAKEIEALEL
jgi:hypothetical protein